MSLFSRTAITTVVVMKLRSPRNALGMSQSRLARLSCVSRYKICMYELGDGSLTKEEWARIEEALKTEAARVQRSLAGLRLDELLPAVTVAEAR